MELRPMKKTDALKAAALAIRVLTPQFKKNGEGFLNKNQYAERLKAALDSMEFGIVIEDKGKFIGFAHWYYENNQAFVEDLLVEPAHEKAHGKALANFVLQTCKKDRVSSVSLLLPHGSPYVKFAEKFGLKPVSVEMKKVL
tara:strand:+ start:70 stop:492 length:423 start_codon:yes stop_codon:yes gene_type:complete